MARSIEGHSLTVHFDNEDMKQQVIDFAGQMGISPGEFMRSAILRTMIEMTKRAMEAKEIYDKEMGVKDEVSVPESGVDEVGEDTTKFSKDTPTTPEGDNGEQS